MWNPNPLLFLLLALSAFSVINGAVPNFYDRRDLQSANTEIIQVADVNGDGIPDIIGGNGTNRIQVFFGRGDGTFSEGPVNTFAVAGIRGFVTGDFNGDGIVDLAIAGELDGDPEPQGVELSARPISGSALGRGCFRGRRSGGSFRSERIRLVHDDGKHMGVVRGLLRYGVAGVRVPVESDGSGSGRESGAHGRLLSLAMRLGSFDVRAEQRYR